MESHSIAVRKDIKMVKSFVRGNKIWIDYHIDKIRHRKSTKLENTKQNQKIVDENIIPALIVKIKTGDIYKKKPKTFKYYSEFFLREKELKTKVFMDRLPYYERVIAHFGKYDVDKITRFDVKNYLFNLNMKSKSKLIYKSAIKEILEFAVDDGVITNNVALNIKLESDNKTNIDYFKKDEVQTILMNATGIIRPYLLIAFNTGMRPEEILGLQFQDIHRTYINIKRVRTRGRIDVPKTSNSFRKVPISSFIYDEIVKLKSKSLFLFKELSDASHLRHQWARVLKDSNLSHKKLYCTRHTYATIMLQENIVSINELAGLLGHSSARVTLTHYSSVIDTKLIKFDKDFSLFGHSFGTVEKVNA